MNQERETHNEKAEKGKKRGLLQGIMERMMVRMMKRCPCSGMMAKEDEDSDFAEMMAQMSNESGEDGFCARMMGTCCGTRVDSPSESQEA